MAIKTTGLDLTRSQLLYSGIAYLDLVRGSGTWGANWVYNDGGLQRDIRLISNEFTNFSTSGAFATDAELSAVSGHITGTRTPAQISTVSGHLTSEIDSDISTASGYITGTDTPSQISTVSGYITSTDTPSQISTVSGYLMNNDLITYGTASGFAKLGSTAWPITSYSGIYIMDTDRDAVYALVCTDGVVSGWLVA